MHIVSPSRAAAVIVFLVTPFSGGHLFGQDPSNPFADLEDGWANPTQPMWAREIRGANTPDWGDVRPDLGQSQPEFRGAKAIVSAEELRHPLSKKGQKLIAKAVRSAQAGNHSKAIEELNAAVQEPSAAPYAHGILGTEYLRLHKVPEAIHELEEAIALMPKNAANHSNLGYALCRSGQIKRGLQEIDTALSLDSSLTRARFLKGMILMDQDSRDKEAWDNLQAAQREVSSAHLALALFYVRHGQGSAADQQLRDYADLGLGVSLPQARRWLNIVAEKVPAGQALGLWDPSSGE